MELPEYRREEGGQRKEEIQNHGGSEARGFAALSLRYRCDRCAAAVMKHSKYSVFSLYRKETKYATVRNEKLSEFSALLAVNVFPKAQRLMPSTLKPNLIKHQIRIIKIQTEIQIRALRH